MISSRLIFFYISPVSKIVKLLDIIESVELRFGVFCLILIFGSGKPTFARVSVCAYELAFCLRNVTNRRCVRMLECV